MAGGNEMLQAIQQAKVNELRDQGFRIVIWDAEFVAMAKGTPGKPSWTPIQVYPDGRVVYVNWGK